MVAFLSTIIVLIFMGYVYVGTLLVEKYIEEFGEYYEEMLNENSYNYAKEVLMWLPNLLEDLKDDDDNEDLSY